MSKYTGKKNVRLYPHKTTGGAEYLSPVAVPGTLEGSFDAPFLIRLDGRPELLGPPLTLIAAAPELLEALQKVTDTAESVNNLQHAGIVIDAELWSLLYDRTNEARAAIAKAEGVTP